MTRCARVETKFGEVTIITVDGKLTVVEFDKELNSNAWLIANTNLESVPVEQDIIDSVLDCINRDVPYTKELNLLGTAFQKQVWEILTKIPSGNTVSYKTIACRIGSPKAYRAVGTACGQNPIAVIVPCHRVIKSDGSNGEYRWGAELKKKLLDREFAKLSISEQIANIEDKKVFQMLDKAVKAANKSI